MNFQSILPKINFKNMPSDSERIHKISVCKILPNPAQPRKYFDSDETLKLADSIRRHGILQPLCVRKPICTGSLSDYDGVFELIAGERRLRAAKLLGLSEVPCVVIEADSLRAAELAIIENLQRENLNMFEEAAAISALIDLYGLTQEEVASKLSSSQSYVANKLRLLRFNEFERQVIIEKGLTERHARALLRISDPSVRKNAIETVVLKSMNVADTEEYVSSIVDICKQEKTPRRSGVLVKDVRIFCNTIDKAVGIMKRAGIDAKAEKKDLGDIFEVTVRIPKEKAKIL